MFSALKKQLMFIDKLVAGKTLEAALLELRELGIDDFGALLLSMPNDDFPNLTALLPPMASVEVQTNWTGNHGLPLLRQTCNFVRSAAYNYMRLTGRSLTQANILDYGCGYGRIARLMYYFTDPARFYGVDPWSRSIELCQLAKLPGTFRVSEYLPQSLPVGEQCFDFIYAFSVFTHLSERATLSALSAIRRHIKDDGVLLITIRPIEYWDLSAIYHHRDDTSAFKAAHRQTGFAFSPHQREAVAGDVTYGDTSMTSDWLEQNSPQWRIAGIDRSFDDEYQIYMFLRPA